MDVDDATSSTSSAPKAKRNKGFTDEMRKIPVPPNRYTPLRENWEKIFSPIVEHLQLQIRYLNQINQRL